MCLVVDSRIKIHREWTYAFYKVYTYGVNGNLETPYYFAGPGAVFYYPPGHDEIAERVSDGFLATDGDLIFGGVHHAYTHKESIRERFPQGMPLVVNTIRVRGQDVVAFGKANDVCFYKAQLIIGSSTMFGSLDKQLEN